MSMNRRQVLTAAGAAILGAGTFQRLASGSINRATKKILFFTKSSGFQHSVIARKGDKPAHAERILAEIGAKHGFEVVASKDGSLFEPGKIDQWDAFAFQTTGDLTQAGTDKTTPMSPEGKQAFLDAIKAGKGFVGMHCATDTFHSHGDTIDPYIKMIGGEFLGHDAQQVAELEVADQHFPGVKDFGSSFELNDEWYSQKNLADDLHVIIAHHTKNMKGRNYQRPDYPETWARMHGKGRVFYTSMGHREDVWENPKYHALLIGALSWVTNQAEADVTPDVSKITPHYKELPKGR